MSHDLTAVVLDASQRSALAVTRSLGRRGICVLTADSIPDPLAGRSRYSAGDLRSPDPTSNPAALSTWLEELRQRRPGAVLLACTDATLPVVLSCGVENSPLGCCLPPANAYFELSDKWHLFQYAAPFGIPVPLTFLVRDPDEIGALADRMSGPFIVKPRQSVMEVSGARRKLPVRRAADSQELLHVVSTTYPLGAELLVQKAVRGEGFGVSAVCNRGRVLAWFAHRRVR